MKLRALALMVFVLVICIDAHGQKCPANSTPITGMGTVNTPVGAAVTNACVDKSGALSLKAFDLGAQFFNVKAYGAAVDASNAAGGGLPFLPTVPQCYNIGKLANSGSWFDATFGARSRPESNRTFDFPNLGFEVWDHSPYSSSPEAQGDPGFLPILKISVHGTGSGDPIPLYANAMYSSRTANNKQDSSNVAGSLIGAEAMNNDLHSGVWGLNVLSAIQNASADQSMFGLELNSFNNHHDSGPEGNPLSSRRKVGFAATSNGAYASHDGFIVVSTTPRNTWHNGFFCQDAKDSCFLAGEPGGGRQAFTNAFAAYNAGLLKYSVGANGNVSTESGITTAGYGNPVTVAVLNLVGLAGPVDPASLYSVGAQTGSAMFVVDFYMNNTVSGAGGSAVLLITYRDETGLHTLSTPALSLAGGAPVQGRLVIYAVGSTNIQYSTTVNGSGGSPQYNVRLRLVAE